MPQQQGSSGAKPGKGLADVVAASTAISDIDGRAGVLSYRGYDIHDLAGAVSFEECAYLLHRGELPSRAELEAYATELSASRDTGPSVTAVLGASVAERPPMEALRTLVSALSADDPDTGSNDPEANARKAARLTAQMPVLVAAYQARRAGREVAPPDPELGIAGNFLLQITGERPDPTAVAMLDECLVLHADHTMNASTFAARVCAATLSDMHSAVTAAMGTLKGPLHGGANEQVMKMLTEIDERVGDGDAGARRDTAERYVRERLDAGAKIMGFGHRVYRTEDPRATHLRKMSESLGELSGDTRWYDMSAHMERTVFVVKGLRPNVDFYAASVYHYLGVPTDLFTPVFAVSRMSGWTAHVIEQHEDNRLIRPDSEYIGPSPRKPAPLGER
ncbi:MAG: citrate synthase [Micromonosporaceae bacterium]|nr:citrate synthase [Micromonosporaceae bacterium]